VPLPARIPAFAAAPPGVTETTMTPFPPGTPCVTRLGKRIAVLGEPDPLQPDDQELWNRVGGAASLGYRLTGTAGFRQAAIRVGRPPG